MLYKSANKFRTNDNVIDTVQNDIDYVALNGDIHVHNKVVEIIVTDADDLEALTGYNVGSIAYTAGFGHIWQLDASGEWIEVGATEESGD